MDLDQWMMVYEEILRDFGFSREEDERAARIMYEMAGNKLLDASVLKVIEGKDTAVVGGAYNGEEIEESFVISAGKAVLKLEVTPDVHVTDMEEDDEILVELSREGCILVLHAHGDNIHRIRSVVPKLENFIATTQSIPFDRVYNFTGFTDGDRAAIIAKRFGASKITLYGFDFKRAESDVKRKKLMWAEKILKLEGLL